MPQNYLLKHKIDVDFSYLKSEESNRALYEEISLGCLDVAPELHRKVTPGYRLVRADKGKELFQIALLCDTTSEVVYYVRCVIMHDVHLNAKPVTQVSLWRTNAIEHESVTVGIAKEVFQKYLLERYNVVASDSCQTREGRGFWERQMGYALASGMFVYRYDRMSCSLRRLLVQGDILSDKVDLWGDEDSYQNILAVISKDSLPAPPPPVIP